MIDYFYAFVETGFSSFEPEYMFDIDEEDGVNVFSSMPLKKECDSSWLAVDLFVGSHFRHSEIKSKASFGQSGIALASEI